MVTNPNQVNPHEEVGPHSDFIWSKPILVLADELAGSCGDIFPMLMQRNGVAKIFGKRTMGLGGNVEPVGELTYSGAKPRLTRGLFTTFKADCKYTETEFIENNGVLPDYPYEHTVEDFRLGYVRFVESFSKVAIEQTR